MKATRRNTILIAASAFFALVACPAFPAALSALSPADGASVPLLKAEVKSYLSMDRAARKAFFDDKDSRRRMSKDEADYPLDFHCIAGADRTGSLAYILNALLGVEEEELWKDWEITGCRNSSLDFGHKSRFEKLVAVFEKYPGATPRERVEAYVKEQGFTDADIAKFREIMLER